MKALALFSGGLDSTLAMKLIIDQGIEVTAVNIKTGFGSTKDKYDHMKNMCDQIGAKLEILDVRKEYLDELLFNPKYGYGKNFNPCIDCHGFMYKHTGKLLKKYDASFMISGEVIGQRPMSQRKEALEIVSTLSEQDDGFILRPLCAKLLKKTKPELLGWVKRDLLLDISGRGRNRQIELAKKYNLTNFESPGGGCLLTDPSFSNRLKEFIQNDQLEVDDINTLKVGRHLRLPNGAKLIIGRNEEDNTRLQETSSKKYLKVKIQDATGPLCLIEKNAVIEDKELATKIIVTYGKTQTNKKYSVQIGKESFLSEKFDTKDLITQYII